MRKVLLALALSLALSGCTTSGLFGTKLSQDISNIGNLLSGVTVTPQAVIIAGNSVDALQDTATAYLRLPLCRTGGSPICRERAATAPIRRTVLAMRAARNSLEEYLAAHPGSSPPATLYERVTAAVSALSAVITQYRADHVVAVIAK